MSVAHLAGVVGRGNCVDRAAVICGEPQSAEPHRGDQPRSSRLPASRMLTGSALSGCGSTFEPNPGIYLGRMQQCVPRVMSGPSRRTVGLQDASRTGRRYQRRTTSGHRSMGMRRKGLRRLARTSQHCRGRHDRRSSAPTTHRFRRADLTMRVERYAPAQGDTAISRAVHPAMVAGTEQPVTLQTSPARDPCGRAARRLPIQVGPISSTLWPGRGWSGPQPQDPDT